MRFLSRPLHDFLIPHDRDLGRKIKRSFIHRRFKIDLVKGDVQETFRKFHIDADREGLFFPDPGFAGGRGHGVGEIIDDAVVIPESFFARRCAVVCVQKGLKIADIIDNIRLFRSRHILGKKESHFFFRDIIEDSLFVVNDHRMRAGADLLGTDFFALKGYIKFGNNSSLHHNGLMKASLKFAGCVSRKGKKGNESKQGEDAKNESVYHSERVISLPGQVNYNVFMSLHKCERLLLGSEKKELASLKGLECLGEAEEVFCLTPPVNGSVRFRVRRGEQEEILDYVMLVGAGEDAVLWEAVREMTRSSLKQAESAIRGTFDYSLVAWDPGPAMAVFDPHDFASLLTNHARRLQAGESRLIRFASVRGVLRKVVDADWGKIRTHLPVSVTADIAGIDRNLRKVLARADENASRHIICVVDIGKKGEVFRMAACEAAEAWRTKSAEGAKKKSETIRIRVTGSEKNDLWLSSEPQAPASR